VDLEPENILEKEAGIMCNVNYRYMLFWELCWCCFYVAK